MFSTALVVFREVLEIAIILGVILAATKGVHGRGKWAWIGVIAGLAGAAVVAGFIKEISGFAEGLGQEIFNAGILIIAALVIAWTVLWMRTHARQMIEKMKLVGREIQEGKIHMYSISIVIALAFLREGSEIVLFGNGILAAGHVNITEFFTGALLGLISGSVVGAALYFGILKISPRHIFKITGWLLIFLAAGMMSIAANYLVSAGVLDVLVEPVWDTSSTLPDSSLLGKILSVLVGYTAIPLGIQLVFYFLTLGALVMITGILDKKHARKRAVLPVAVAIILLAGGQDAHAANKKVYSPYVEKGELEVEYKGTYTNDGDSSKSGENKNELGLGYGFTNYWASEIEGELARDAGIDQQYRIESIEWENKFQLTEPGEYWADFGLLASYEFAVADSHAPDELQVLALVEKDFGKFANVLNLGFERQTGENSHEGTVGILKWSSRYRAMPEFEPGFEIHNDMGELHHGGQPFNQQEAQAGPVAYGNLGHGLSYEAGYLFGVSKAAPDGEAKLVIEYGIPL